MTEADKQTALKLCLLERQTCGYFGSTLFTECWCPEGDCPCHSIGFQEVHGHIPLLDPKLVRVECAERHYGQGGFGDPISCAEAGCLGFTPSTDPWAYVTASMENLGHAALGWLQDAIWDALWEKQDPGLAAFTVVAEASLKGEA